MAFDGSEFIAIDEDAITYDLTDGAQSLDAFVDHAIRSNLVHVGAERSRTVYMRLGGQAHLNFEDPQVEIRTHASLGESTLVHVPWKVGAGLKTVEFNFWARVSALSGVNEGAMAMRYELAGIGDHKETMPATYDSGVEVDIFTEIRVVLEFDRYVTRDLITDLAVWGRSFESGSTVRSSATYAESRSSSRFKSYGAGGLWDRVNTLGTCPNTSDAAVQYLADTSTGAKFDHLHVVSDTEAHVLALQGSLAQLDTPKCYDLSFLQLRSIEVVEVHDPEAFAAPASRYQAGEIVRSAEETKLFRGAESLNARSRCLWIGPQGAPFLSESEFPSGYSEKFTRCNDDAGTGSILLSSSFVPSQLEDPKIELLVNLLPIHTAVTYRAESYALEDLRNDAATVSWTLELVIQSWTSGGGWVDIGSASQDFSFTHWPTDHSGAWPALYQEWIRERYTLRDVSHNFVSGSFYSFREGQLYARDLGLLQRVQLVAPITYTATDQDLLRFRLECTRNGQEYGIADYNDPFFLNLVATGATLWETP